MPSLIIHQLRDRYRPLPLTTNECSHRCDVTLQWFLSLFPLSRNAVQTFRVGKQLRCTHGEHSVCLLCSFTYTVCGGSLMTAEAGEQEGLVTMVSSNIHILCQYLQMVRVCVTDQLSLLLGSDTRELLNINTDVR